MNARLQDTQPALSAEQAIGQIAVELPGSTAVFRRLKLDFAAAARSACARRLHRNRWTWTPSWPSCRNCSAAPTCLALPRPAELVDHILARYHEVHRAQLPELIRMARRVEAVHRDNPHVPAGLADTLEAMHEELLSHMEKEETILFPMLKTGGNAFVVHPIGMMRAEHVDHGEALTSSTP